MRKGEVTRNRIIQQAAPIFNQHGFEGSSLSHLMSATGLKKGGIYRHFATKEDLAAEAFRFAISTSLRIRTDNFAHGDGAVAKLRSIVQRFIDAPAGMPGGCPLMNTAIDADDGNPHLRKLALEAMHTWRSSLSRIVQEGVAAGEITGHIGPDSVANFIISSLEGALMISRLEHSRRPLKDAQNGLEALFVSISMPHPSTPNKRSSAFRKNSRPV